ncbi:hypothetical protein GCM10009647_062480 [Streptomyces sanglieri]
MTAPTATDAPRPEVGRSRARKEDARLVTGRTTWTDNITMPGLLHLAILRSPTAHARIDRIDVAPALERPGVIAALTGRDLADEPGPMPCVWPVTEDIVMPDHPAFAVDEVRYAGEPVAVVVARGRYAAADALEAVEVDYTPLPPVLGLEAAPADDAPLVHAGKGTNRCYTWPLDTGNYAAQKARADVVLRRRYTQQRLIPNAVEPRAVIATPPTASNEYTLYSATQVPHVARVILSVVTGIPEQRLRVIAPDVGGGFGSKLQVYGEEAVALALARKLGRPAKWTESRSEGSRAPTEGNLVSGTMADHLVPAAPDLPDFVTDRTETPATSDALGVKGVGEAGTIASTPAVVNAVVDALRPLGVRDVAMPCTPQRIWQAVTDARAKEAKT